jgi:HPt (histidine-containing phosphotransfer) domain-containing protein
VSNPNSGIAHAGSAPTQLIDHERAEEVIDLICEGEHAAFGGWVDHLETDLAKFEALLPATDTMESNRGIQGAAHSIKGTCLNLGAIALGELFSLVEQDAKEGKLAALNQRYAESLTIKTESIRELRAIAAKGSVA